MISHYQSQQKDEKIVGSYELLPIAKQPYESKFREFRANGEMYEYPLITGSQTTSSEFKNHWYTNTFNKLHILFNPYDEIEKTYETSGHYRFSSTYDTLFIDYSYDNFNIEIWKKLE